MTKTESLVLHIATASIMSTTFDTSEGLIALVA